MEEPGRLWLVPSEARGAAIPVPVRKILAGLDSAGRFTLREALHHGGR
jgi:hypothetical protein